ncbi:MAG: extracellular solute-binding protein [Candidatus Fimadaptatus sp.]|jgi:putative aldouronate transport system substrate-binding protein
MKKLVCLLVCLMLAVSGSAFAAELAEPGVFPVTNEDVTINVFAPVTGGSEFDWNTCYMTGWYQEQTGVKVNWTGASQDVFIEKLNLALSSEEDLDLIVAGGSGMTQITSTMVVKYADQELILPIEQYIDNNTVSMKQRLDSVEGFRTALTTPDGHIYAVPWYNECYHCMYYGKMWVNNEFLKNCNLEVPTTVDEFKNMLIAFRDQDANGNGDPSDEIPMIGAIDSYGAKVDTFLMSAFIYDDGENRLMIDDDGKVMAVFTQPEFKEGLKYLADLYSENLIYPDSFAQNRNQRNEINSRKYESVCGAMPNIHHGIGSRDTDAGETARFLEYTPIKPLVGPNGLQVTRVNYFDNFGLNGTAGLIPATCEQPELVMQWLDLLYTDEGIMMQDLGIKGVSWDDPDEGALGVDGSPATYKKITMTPDQEYYNNMSWGQVFPEFMTAEHRLGYQQTDGMMAEDGSGLEAFLYHFSHENYAPYGIPQKNVVPPLYYSEEDASEMAMLQTNINTYVEECIAKFIVGQMDIESDWETFQNELKNMKIDRYLEIIQNTYDASAFSAK